jgi:hypothetical protein
MLVIVLLTTLFNAECYILEMHSLILVSERQRIVYVCLIG